MVHPEASAAASPGVHLLTVQAMLSSHTESVGMPEQVPSAAHTSPIVHAVPSSHELPAGTCGCIHSLLVTTRVAYDNLLQTDVNVM